MNYSKDFSKSQAEPVAKLQATKNKARLNDQQMRLVMAPLDQPVVGVAGAGTGKTTAIIARACEVLKKTKGRILLITFTRLAAGEMRQRLAKLCQADARRAQIGTFHSVIAQIIRAHASEIGLTSDFTILGEAEANALYTNAFNNLVTQYQQKQAEQTPSTIQDPQASNPDCRRSLIHYFGNRYHPTERDKQDIIATYLLEHPACLANLWEQWPQWRKHDQYCNLEKRIFNLPKDLRLALVQEYGVDNLTSKVLTLTPTLKEQFCKRQWTKGILKHLVAKLINLVDVSKVDLSDNDFANLTDPQKEVLKDLRNDFRHAESELVKQRSGKEIDLRNLKLLIGMLSQLINTASCQELLADNLDDPEHISAVTRRKLFDNVVERTFYYDGMTAYSFMNSEDYDFKCVVNLLFQAFLQSIQLALKANVLAYDQILFVSLLMTLKNGQIATGSDLEQTILGRYRQIYDYIIVDEYQDTNCLQDNFVNAVSHNNLTVVGDIDQAIYEFRGGSVDLMVERIRQARAINPSNVINLTINYRSDQTILDAANNLIAHNEVGQESRKPLRAARASNGHQNIGVVLAVNTHDEAASVVQIIRKLHQHKVSYNKMAVLVRTRLSIQNFLIGLASLPAEQKKIAQKIPLNNQTKYADIMKSDYMMDVINYLNILVNPKNTYAFVSIMDRPKRGIGDKTFAFLERLADQRCQSIVDFILSDNLVDVKNAGRTKLYQTLTNFVRVYHRLSSKGRADLSLSQANDDHDKGDLVRTVDEILREVGYIAWMEGLSTDAVKRFRATKQTIDTNMELFETEYRASHDDVRLFDLINAYLVQIQDLKPTDNPEGVVLNTVHGVKGLEYDFVFILDANNGTFPFVKAELDQERRLMYVAVTRAKYGTVLYALDYDGAGRPSSPSSFISEMGSINMIQTPQKQDCRQKKASYHHYY